MISITGGHGDFRQRFEAPRIIGGPLNRLEQIGASTIAETPDEVRVRRVGQLGRSSTPTHKFAYMPRIDPARRAREANHSHSSGYGEDERQSDR